MYIYIYIYITNCRQYCFGLLGLISAVLMSRMEVKLKKPPQMSHTCGTSIYIYIYKMARWYCVKAKKQTECVQRSGYKTARN